MTDVPESTCWTLIQGAAAGSSEDRAGFTHRYGDVLRAYFRARWTGRPAALEIEDAMQEVFLECFRGGGVLERADPGCEGGFRAFLFGVARNVALRVEKRLAKARARGDGNAVDLDDIESDETAQSAAFDRAWAEALVREASEVQRRQAEHAGPECRRRIELLDLRFGEGVPIRDIAKLWDEDPVLLHREYEKARREFLGALREVVAFHHQGLPGEIDRECERLQELLS